MTNRGDSTDGEERKSLSVPSPRESVTARATVFTLAARINQALENDKKAKSGKFGADYDSDDSDDDSSDDDSDSD